MENKHIIYEGKNKILYEGPEEGTLILHFKDYIQNYTLKLGEGALNNRTSAFLLSKFGEIGLSTHFIKYVNMREQLVRALDMLPFEIHVLNNVTPSLCKRLHLTEGSRLARPLIEYHLPQKDLNASNVETLLTEEHLLVLGWATPSETEEIVSISLRLNDFLTGLFAGIGFSISDFKVKFGRHYNPFLDDTHMTLGDILTPGSYTLWPLNLPSSTTMSSPLAAEEASYEIARRLNLLPDVAVAVKDFKAPPLKSSKPKLHAIHLLQQKDL